MADDHAPKLWAAFVALLGAFWLTLTGLCTWNYARTPSQGWEGLWPVGLFLMSPGLALLAVGLKFFVPSRVLAAVLIIPGVAWLLIGVSLIIPTLSRPEPFRSASDLGIGAAVWLVFQLPGALMVWAGVRRLRSKAGAVNGQGRS